METEREEKNAANNVYQVVGPRARGDFCGVFPAILGEGRGN